VLFLQKVGRTGYLTNLRVSSANQHTSLLQKVLRSLYDINTATFFPTLSYCLVVASSLSVLVLLVLLEDWWALAVVVILVLARVLNIFVLRRRAARAAMGWKGASEPGVNGDLLILLSQDRWIRMRGAVDDLKAVTSGQWLQEPTFFESSLVAFATLLVYLNAALAGNAHQEGKVLLLVLLFCSVALLGITNEYTEVLKMHGKLVKVIGSPYKYERRLILAQELIKESGRDDWAVRLGMIVPERDADGKTKLEGPATM